MHAIRSILISAAALGLTLASAHAAEEKQSRETPSFNEMDQNSDGKLTRDEASVHAKLSAHFDQVDDDRDGRLTRGEYLEIMARQDLHTLRSSLAEFIDPEGKPPLARAQQPGAGAEQANSQESLPMAVSPELVRTVQDTLRTKGVNPGPVDGIWGPRTHQALREFQDREGLEATGQLNALTLATLGIAGAQTAAAGGSTAQR